MYVKMSAERSGLGWREFFGVWYRRDPTHYAESLRRGIATAYALGRRISLEYDW